MRIVISIIQIAFLGVIWSGCGDPAPDSQSSTAFKPTIEACEDAFHHNRKVDVATATRPYMKTCGLDVASAKYLLDVYSRDMSVNQAYVDIIYDEFETTDKILTKHNIPYYLVSGSLLGALRNGGLSPNDDDVDIGVDIKYEQQVFALKEEFSAAGYDIVFDTQEEGTKIIKQGTNSSGLDIFFTKIRQVDGKDVMAFARAHAWNVWPNEWVTPEALNNLSRIPFGHLSVLSVPTDEALKYMDRHYGGDWYEVTYKIYDHVNRRAARGVKEKLLPTEYYHLRHSKAVSTSSP